jgi:hypothetical protein
MRTIDLRGQVSEIVVGKCLHCTGIAFMGIILKRLKALSCETSIRNDALRLNMGRYGDSGQNILTKAVRHQGLAITSVNALKSVSVS